MPELRLNSGFQPLNLCDQGPKKVSAPTLTCCQATAGDQTGDPVMPPWFGGSGHVFFPPCDAVTGSSRNSKKLKDEILQLP